jgi:uncharacterized membrane protein
MANVQKTIEVPVPVHEVYNQWTQFETFPRFMEGVEEVRQMGDRRMHWRAKVAGRMAEWDAEITEQIPDRLIAWRSIGGRGNAGVVEFYPVDGARTQVSLRLEAETDGAAEAVGDKLGVLDRQVEGDLKRFRDYMAKRPTAEGEYRGRIERTDPN